MADTAIEVAAIYFLGYSAIDHNTGEQLPVYPSENGWLEIAIGGTESSSITVAYTGTFLQNYSWCVSAFFLLSLGGFYLYKKRRNA